MTCHGVDEVDGDDDVLDDLVETVVSDIEATLDADDEDAADGVWTAERVLMTDRDELLVLVYVEAGDVV